ncbi:MAG: glutamine--fructose-6-phosphate transaminase (isomerizing) [Oscillospiraceae bacterium]
MCGIVGYTGAKQAAPLLLSGLEKLEYRGYDSAGIAVKGDGGIKVAKAMGRLTALKALTNDGKNISGTTGIGHTRWATHGKPSDENSHPHLSDNGRIAIVHNGIIENYKPLKGMLINRGRVFVSETDTEVAAQLIDYYYEGNLLEAVARAVRELEGSYALGIVCADDPDTIIGVKCHAPLIVAYGKDGNMFASDVMAVVSETKKVTYLDDGDIAVVRPDSITFYTPFLDRVEKEIKTIDWDISSADKGGYEHYMFKEIMEQPEAVRRTCAPFIKGGVISMENIIAPELVKKLKRIFIVACGSSYHVGVIAKYNIEKLARIPVEVVLASEFRYCDPIVDKDDLVILISQSGETADTLEALYEARRRGGRTLAIVNVEGSSIAQAADGVIYTKAGPEIAVATTKAYSTQLAITVMMAMYFARLRGTIAEDTYGEILQGLVSLPENMQAILNNKAQIQKLAYQYFNNEDIFFIGRNIDYALSLEGSLKLKEISYIHSEAYAAGELKHGTISLVVDGTLVIAVATHSALVEKTISNAQETKARGAKVLVVTTDALVDKVADSADNIIAFAGTNEVLLPSLAVLPLQLFSYYMALYRGCDIDKPRNLAKSVTVE